MKRVLFVCSQNTLRSPTAEAVFAGIDGLEVASAGLGHDAEVPVSMELLEWADMIMVMERSHRNKLSKEFRSYLKNKRVVCLDIPDEYDYMGPVLVKILKRKVSPFLA